MRHFRLLAGLALTGLVVAMLAVPAAAQNHAREALLIANAAYPDVDKPLPFAVKDTSEIAAELRRLGFRVEVKTDAGKQDMGRAIEAFIGRIGRDDTALFYFTGFGLQLERETYLVPVDAQIWADADIRRDGLSVSALVARMQRKNAGAKIIVVDAGRQSPFTTRLRQDAAGLMPFEMPTGTLVLYSTALGRTTDDAGAHGHSVFAAALLRELRSSDASIERLFNRVRIEVSRASAGKQVPWVASSLSRELNLADRTAIAPAAPEREAAPAPAAKVASLPGPSGTAEPSGSGGLAQAGRWQTVVQGRRKIVCVFDLQPDGHYRFGDRCPAPYSGETGDADIKGGKYIMRAKSGRVERGTITMDGKDRFIARSGGGRVVWTRVD